MEAGERRPTFRSESIVPTSPQPPESKILNVSHLIPRFVCAYATSRKRLWLISRLLEGLIYVRAEAEPQARSDKVKVNGYHWRRRRRRRRGFMSVVVTVRQFVWYLVVPKTSALNCSKSVSVKTRRPQLERRFPPPQSESSLVSALLESGLVIRDQSINSQ